MSNLSTKITLYAKSKGVNSINFLEDVKLRDLNDGNGAYIFEWNLEIAEPTDEQLASYETAGNTQETLNGVLSTRKTQYGSWQSQMEMIYKDQKDGTTTFKDHCDKVRSDNPKD